MPSRYHCREKDEDIYRLIVRKLGDKSTSNTGQMAHRDAYSQYQEVKSWEPLLGKWRSTSGSILEELGEC